MTQPILGPLQALSKCPLCGDAGRKALFLLKESTLYECEACRLRYLDPCLSEAAMKSAYESSHSLTRLHSFHEGYYEYGDLDKESKTLADFRRGLEILEKYVKGRKAPSILDVGFGNGLFLALARQRGWRVQGVDHNTQNVELARKKFSLDCQQVDLEDYENEGFLYDVISFWDVIEHLPDPHRVLRKAASLLKPDGLVLAAVPNDRSFLTLAASGLYHLSFGRIKKGIEAIYLLEHVAYYNRETLTALLEKNGFQGRESFLTSTDLAKYKLSAGDKLLASILLRIGKLTGLENRLVAIFQKNKTL